MRSIERDPAVTVIVNGEQRQLNGRSSLLDLLCSLDLDPRSVVVELNREIVRGAALERTRLQPGDQVELVHFVGGG